MNDRGTPRLYSQDERAKAMASVVELGLAEAAAQTGIPKSTLHLWCTDAGIPTSTDEGRQRTEAATAASVVARRQRVEQAKGRMTLILATIAELAARAEIQMIQDGKASLSELVGARTRALHDLQLLSGDATERFDSVDDVESVAALRDQLRSRLGTVA